MQVIFNLPSFCEDVLEFFDEMDPESLNDTSKVFISKLKVIINVLKIRIRRSKP
jgi:hypothetical protein